METTKFGSYDAYRESHEGNSPRALDDKICRIIKTQPSAERAHTVKADYERGLKNLLKEIGL